jgi:hypothetical protein
MSEYSDSDIIDYLDFEELMDEFSEDDFKIYKEEPRSQKKTKEVKYGESLTDEKILTNNDSIFLCTKSKGVGKKSKGKENQADKTD